MNTFAQCLYPENILLGMDAADKWQAFAQLALRLEREHQIGHALLYESLCEREELGSTAIGEGVAIPHACIKGLRRPMTAFVRLKNPVEFDAPDGKRVMNLFVLFIPGKATSEHLQLLADTAEMLCDTEFRDRLDASNEHVEIRELFSSYGFHEAGEVFPR